LIINMSHLKLVHQTLTHLLILITIAAACQAQSGLATRGQNKVGQEDTAAVSVPHPAEDISGMYSFLKEGEFVQITVEKSAVSGYISRMGDSDSDNGVFLDQFFTKADVQGHQVSFTTRQLHSMWYEFNGKFDRGSAKTKADDGYYILRGTLKEFTTSGGKSVATRSREVQFKLLAQTDDSEPTLPQSKN
jgi:hypothetical protein